MKTKIQKWGNSLALRIPKTFASEAQLAEDSTVEVSLIDGKLVIAVLVEPEFTLEQLLEGVTEQNIHGEVDTGNPVGNEVW